MNQGLITNKGGAKLLATAASRTDDPQTLRMVAGAIANLCGNGKAVVNFLKNRKRTLSRFPLFLRVPLVYR